MPRTRVSPYKRNAPIGAIRTSFPLYFCVHAPARLFAALQQLFDVFARGRLCPPHGRAAKAAAAEDAKQHTRSRAVRRQRPA